MARRTFGQALDEAKKIDTEYGTEHRGDAVICQMLAHISSKQESTLAKSTAASRGTRADSGSQAPRSGGGKGVGSHNGKKAPAQLLVKSRVAAAQAASKKSQPKPRRRAWTSAQVAAALDDGVKRGRISGSAAVVAMKAFEGKR